MKLLFLLLFLTGNVFADQWIEGSIVGVQKHGPTSYPPVVFLNTYTKKGLGTYSQNEWVTVDISDKVPINVIEITLDGILVITHGTTQETCDLNVWFKSTDNVGNTSYSAQAIEALTGSGERQTDMVKVPLIDGKFRFKWDRKTPGNWPTNCAYAVSYRLVGYVR